MFISLSVFLNMLVVVHVRYYLESPVQVGQQAEVSG